MKKNEYEFYGKPFNFAKFYQLSWEMGKDTLVHNNGNL